MVNEINNRISYTIIGWYKRETINNRSITQDINRKKGDAVANAGHMEHGTTSYHICQILPTNCKALETNQLGQHLKALKYDTSRLTSANIHQYIVICFII